MTSQAARTPTDGALEELRRHRVRRVSGEPLYLQAARSIGVILGMYSPDGDTPIPPETEMAAALGIGRPTLRQALSHLAQEGRIYTKRGVGTFVAPAVLNRPARLSSLYDDLEARGLRPTTRVLEITTVAATEDVAADLHITVGAPLMVVRRIRSAAEKPVAVIDNLLNLSGAPAPTVEALERTGLYTTLSSQYGIELSVASLRVSARLATRDQRVWLGLRHPCAVLVARRLAFDTRGTGVEIGTTVYSEGAEIDGIRLQP